MTAQTWHRVEASCQRPMGVESWLMGSKKALRKRANFRHSSIPPFPGPPALFFKKRRLKIGIKNSNLSYEDIVLYLISLMKFYSPFLDLEGTLWQRYPKLYLHYLNETNMKSIEPSVKKINIHIIKFIL